MELRTVVIQNFKALQNVTLSDLPRFLVVVGANGRGKSTLFDVFSFLRDALSGNVKQAFEARGGFREVVTRGHEEESIVIQLQVRLEIAGKLRLATYHVEISEEKGRPVVLREFLRYKRGGYFLDFAKGKGFAVSDEETLDREEQALESPDILAIKGLGQFQRFKAASALRQMLESWHVSDFHISAARGRKEALGPAEHLSVTGDNLPRVAQFLYENHREVFDKILQRMQHRVPGIEGVTPELTQDGYLVLRFRDGSFKTPFS